MPSLFYDLDPLAQVAVNLFYGWGYNFYKAENQARADDQLIRSKACSLLGLAARHVLAAETEYRREHLQAPSRAKPFPDADAVSGAQRLERLAAGILALETLILNQPVPENDRMTERFRQELPTLHLLARTDSVLVGQCDLMRSLSEKATGEQLLAKITDLEEGLSAMRTTLEERSAILFNIYP